MNELNNMKRWIVSLMAVFALAATMVVPAFAQEEVRIGTAEAVTSTEAIQVRVIKETLADGTPSYTPVNGSSFPSPSLPISNYTCYLDGIQIPCELISWLWD